MEIERTYGMLGVCPKVYEFGEAVLNDLKPRFEAIDRRMQSGEGAARDAEEPRQRPVLCRDHRLRLR